MDYIDFHTHQPSFRKNVLEIVSLHFDDVESLKEDYFFTLGRHPWWTKNELTLVENKLFIKLISQKNCLGIGEVGLDKLQGDSMENQVKYFKQILEIASEFNKPVTVHCVKAFDKLFQLKKEFPKIKKWCIHGFCRNEKLARQLIDSGFYISLKATMNMNEKLINTIPLNRLFLETDDSGICIEQIYEQVCNVKGIKLEQLKNTLYQNFKKFHDFA